MDWKKIGRALLYPHIVIMLILIPISVALIIVSRMFFGIETIIAYLSYAISTYTLFVWCVRIPKLIKYFRNNNKYAIRWRNDTQLRANVLLCVGLIWNVSYASLQMWLGFSNKSFWFFSLALYYIFLAIMRFLLVRYTRKNNLGENRYEELLRYRNCGVIFLFMNLSLSLMIFFMVYLNRHFEYNEIVTIAIATYTFTTMTVAIVNLFKNQKQNSPVLSASRIISLTSACVSMLILESTMLNTFGQEGEDLLMQRLMLGISGGVISIFILTLSIYMLIKSSKELQKMRR